jgi:hypothetical protein
MAAGTWKLFTRGKRNIGNSGIALNGVFRMCLCKASASASILKNTNTGISTWASVGSEIAAQGGYAAHGRSLPVVKWTVGASTKQYKFSYTATGIIFTASGANLSALKYAILRNSTGSNAGKVLAYCTLSTAAFSISSPNTLTILPAATGVFTLA